MDRLKLNFGLGLRKGSPQATKHPTNNDNKPAEHPPSSASNEEETSSLSLSNLTNTDPTKKTENNTKNNIKNTNSNENISIPSIVTTSPPSNLNDATRRPLSLRLTAANVSEENGPDLYKLLAENKLTEQDVWEGAPTLFPILYQFRDVLVETAMKNPEQVVTSFQLPGSVPEFSGTGSKAYKINTKFTAFQTISLICPLKLDTSRF
eukprot:TRINITY_DN1393_c0_g1_i1.p1 TRINITY_DN1393_c0_g1~~TRINITY_DN1393_c0_g1_i1.p1  ORF type:complete len:207 (+),score=54.55 TRINITY_DN1393_c0_g1_i1:762-1382(+)